MTIKINMETCTGCGLCAKDCTWSSLNMKADRPEYKASNCINCNHCVAVCPVKAIEDQTAKESPIEKEDLSKKVGENEFIDMLKFRRTTRQFEKGPIKKEVVEKILDAGRVTQTARNSEDVSFIVLQDEMETVKDMALKKLNKMADEILDDEENVLYRYAKIWKKMYETHREDPTKWEDKLFFNGSAVILILAENPTNAILAASNMVLMAETMGVGSVLSGFTTRGLQENQKFKERFNVPSNKEIGMAVVVGKPNVEYMRTAPRKTLEVIWR